MLLVFGGSRGARSINQALAGALPDLLPHCQIVHVSGTLDWPQVEAQAASLPDELRPRYHAYPYLHDEMPLALAAADLVVARAARRPWVSFRPWGCPASWRPIPTPASTRMSTPATWPSAGQPSSCPTPRYWAHS